jgi:hypothetical protein
VNAPKVCCANFGPAPRFPIPPLIGALPYRGLWLR